MRQTFSNKMFLILLFAIVSSVILAELTHSGGITLFALALTLLGWGTSLVCGLIDMVVNKDFTNLKNSLAADNFSFQGPVEVTSTPGGAKATIDSQTFCLSLDKQIKCFKPQGGIVKFLDISYRRLRSTDDVDYIIAYDHKSDQFGLFRRDR